MKRSDNEYALVEPVLMNWDCPIEFPHIECCTSVKAWTGPAQMGFHPRTIFLQRSVRV